jgi:hypothetical protein
VAIGAYEAFKPGSCNDLEKQLWRNRIEFKTLLLSFLSLSLSSSSWKSRIDTSCRRSLPAKGITTSWWCCWSRLCRLLQLGVSLIAARVLSLGKMRWSRPSLQDIHLSQCSLTASPCDQAHQWGKEPNWRTSMPPRSISRLDLVGGRRSNRASEIDSFTTENGVARVLAVRGGGHGGLGVRLWMPLGHPLPMFIYY